MQPSPIACRVSSYRPFDGIALREIARLGLRNVEIKLPGPAGRAAMREELSRHGLTATSVQVPCPLDHPDVASTIAADLQAVSEFGAGVALICCQSHGLPHELICERLRGAAEAAGRVGVMLAVETHPDLAENAAASLRMLAAVGHSALAINFDPANIYFYNQGLDAAVELRQIASHVVAVHLKDTPGGYRERNFPALGQGVVDFPTLFGELDAVGFTGPCAIEIDGTEGETRDEALVCARVRESVDFLRRIGRLN